MLRVMEARRRGREREDAGSDMQKPTGIMEPRILPSGPNQACNQLGRDRRVEKGALGEERTNLTRGIFLLRLPMWRLLIILEGVLPGKGNKSDGEAGGPTDEAR